MFCQVELGQWEEGDNPMIEHNRWAPSCPFVRAVRAAKDKTKNIDIRNVKICNDECGIYTLEVRPFSHAQKGK